ncbi:TAXI family TRAP transporter solute-binding subunit [Halomonas sp. McH1-25]|uniref:TAXI family TRAP transporter solute-binding subunit n=1 Tax=unclassified Halomonas TaxID=2609666 RepID=UPI001EF4CAB2|nr:MULTISPECIES: TAXI family TRAP transporter solute-binding subunit [unclassified Halomonas]MCG7602088.1 TAXI family TRAP transporter solute-binding subunit [Halomonas sp. McH1-25]MCP1343004.1 TAXI family TRAP transporter solute-binding subunit [Halomonas sp. FL8]MCP1362540.1 TAXI family TRAP transporter solute-binding subunit [Halomonas sp. BBD45]
MVRLQSRLTLCVTAAAIALASLSGTAQERPSSLTVSTASPGGVYAIYGEGVAQLVSDVVGVPTSTRQTQGPAQNLVLLQSNQAELAMVTSGPAYEAMNGELSLMAGQEYDDLRVLFAMYPTPFQMIAPASANVSSIEDFNGKRLGAGPRAGTGGEYWTRWLEDMGVDADLQYGGIGDQASQLADGRLDAIVTAGGIPHPSLSELENTQDVVIFGMSDKVQSEILKLNPYAVEFTIPQGTYETPKKDLQTVAMWNFMTADADMSEELAYEITKAVLENNERMRSTHSAAKDTLAENIVKNTFIPLHPGAARYYEEIGVKIPDSIQPQQEGK